MRFVLFVSLAHIYICLQKEALGQTCPGNSHLNISAELQQNAANLLDFTTKLRGIVDARIYKEHLSYVTSLVTSVGLPGE